MKIYLYCPETGIYQGEDFTDGSSMTSARVPADGYTTIAPPPYSPGEVPVFHAAEKCWKVQSNGRSTKTDTGEKS